MKKATPYNKRKKVIDKLDHECLALWKQVVMKIKGGRCPVCGNPASVVHHIFSRHEAKFLKFNIENGIPLCNSCHYKHHFTECRAEVDRKIMKWITDTKWKKLQSIAHTTISYNIENLTEIKNKLLDELYYNNELTL